ncbi:MAG: ATP-binding protein [Candidatus Tectomicrobia bacterium]|nr:ATP-binding protein [Candidatus Tectomicrobia bacterium]
MRKRLLWKLFSINLPVIGVVILVVWLAIDYLAADYFMTLMKQYNISPTMAHQMFLEAVHRYLLWASLLAIACAALCSLVLTRKVLRPLSQMTEITRGLASGEYTQRVQIASQDEVGQLGEAFNRMADSLQRIEQLRRRMVSDVAHELRTPLTTMRGYLEALRDQVIDPSADTFDMLHEETLRLVKLSEDLLELTKADAAPATLNRQDVSLHDLIEQTVDWFQPQFATKGIDVKIDIAADAQTVMADPDKLSQALRNVLHNAWQYTPSDGRVSVTVKRQPTSIVMAVCNTGEDVLPQDLPYIFERFYRGEKSRSRAHGGAGIGLAVVKGIIEAHGGQVGAASSDGTTRVWVSLPA